MSNEIQKNSSSPFTPNCLSIDLEVGINDHRIYQFAAVRGDSGQSISYNKGDIEKALDKLDAFSEGVAFLLGHNIIAFDLPHLAAKKPGLSLLKKPAVDTLRLNPLAFPRNPYHHLVKHYQDGQLKRGRLNDPELDARLTLEVFHDQSDALRACYKETPELVLAWHWLTTIDENSSGLNVFFSTLRRKSRPSDDEASQSIYKLLDGSACLTNGREIVSNAKQQGWVLAYALAWLSVAGGNSVMPPWVRHQFPEAGALVKLLRDTACSNPTCKWCSERHDARKELKRWFGFDEFRPEPKGEDGRPLQQAIVEAAMQGKHVLGILPTGTGKSLCYQIPALSRFDKTGSLTIVISPLVALMADQVVGLEKRGITSCAAINGLLSMPERADVLDRVRLGDVGILIVSPEQLRNRSLRKVLAQREISSWVLDEAHCISKWGHDFRPDYRYVGRFIKEKAGHGPIPPILCLTATAKPDVVADILDHFRDKVGVELNLYDGGASRTNLEFAVVATTPAEKFSHTFQILMADLPPEVPGGAIVYCATRKQTEEIASFLREKGLPAAHFHAGLQPETKKSVQDSFIRGDLRVISATNAFGMGIDKPDVRLVIHADIPGSLENYLQEAGRAGRDRQFARCVLLYTPDDVERQFGMSARSRLTQREIQSILKSLKNLDRRKRFSGEVVATTGEILTEEVDGVFARDSATDDTRVRTAIAWLEEAQLLTRDENQVQVFPSSLRVSSVEEAQVKLSKQPMTDEYKRQLLSLIDALIAADPDDGISTDELMAVSGLSPEKVRSALYDLEKLGIASNDTALTAFVHVGVEHSSRRRYEEAAELEQALISELRESAPDLGKGDTSFLHLRHATQRIKDAGHNTALPEKLWRIIKGLTMDGRNEDGGTGSLRAKRLDAETVQVSLQREWSALEKTAKLRREAASILLEHFLTCLPPSSKGTDLLAETTLGKLLSAIDSDMVIKSEVKDSSKILDRSLMWLHELEIIRLNKGLAVFRPAMTIHLAQQDKRNFIKSDFIPLKSHYDEQIIQIHVMAEYVQRGIQAMADALKLAMDYFSLSQEEFLKRWLPGREKDLERQTTPESWRLIVESLRNPIQQKIVADDREQTNVLVLAGPGSGKTRVLVHRIAYLVRVRRENPKGIIALAYNRHAAVEIRKRLTALIGDDANGVTVMTCHALAMRLVGASFTGRDLIEENAFKQVLQQATGLLKGEGLPPEEADEQRDRLLSGFRWILVDEYQDIGPDQYELISALAGRTHSEEDGKLSLFAVGDDDQNIYSFDGASVEFIRRFEDDYAAKPSFLTENYRSSGHIIAAANHVISSASRRMKADHPITIDRARKGSYPGGEWQRLDKVGQGKVQILPAGNDPLTQTISVMAEFERLAKISQNWNWAECAIISREWKYLEPFRAYCETHHIPVQMADEDTNFFWRLRETQELIDWIRNYDSKIIDAPRINDWLDTKASNNAWWALLRESIDAYSVETAGAELPKNHFFEWLAEWGRDLRRRQEGLLLLTAHRAKGLEFDYVAVIDGAWGKIGRNEDIDASRRLYYVAMTRARKILLLAQQQNIENPFLRQFSEHQFVLHRQPSILPTPTPDLDRHYKRVSLKEVDLGYAGRYPKEHPLHHAIAALEPGDPIMMEKKNDRWELTDQHGNCVGKMAKKYSPPTGTTFLTANVRAIISWQHKDTKTEHQDRVRCDSWEVILPELTFRGD